MRNSGQWFAVTMKHDLGMGFTDLQVAYIPLHKKTINPLLINSAKDKVDINKN